MTITFRAGTTSRGRGIAPPTGREPRGALGQRRFAGALLIALALGASGDGVRADECLQTGCSGNYSLSGCRQVCGAQACNWVSDPSYDMLTCGGGVFSHVESTSWIVTCVGEYDDGEFVKAVPPPTFVAQQEAAVAGCLAWSGCGDPSNDPVCGDTEAASGCGSFPRDCEPEPSEGDPSGAGGGQGRQDTQSCEDLAGTDPIHLSTKSAITEPFTDFEHQGLGSIKLQRTYSSADKSVPKPNGGSAYRQASAPGIFGRGWHHNWEAYLTCYTGSTGDFATCTLVRGLKSQKIFSWRRGMTAYGTGEAWDYFTRQGLEAVLDGDPDLLVGRWVNGALQELVIFGVDGTELHFQQEPVSDTVNCAYSDKRYCPAAWGTGGQDVMSGGKAALTRAVSLEGEVTEVSRSIATGLLLRLRDAATGGTVELVSDGVNLSLARTLRVNGSAYLHYDYTHDGTYQASGYDLTAVRTPSSRTIRGYTYNQDHQHPGHLHQVLGEADDGQAGPLLVEFGYDASHRATRVTDERSSATVQYLDPSSIQVNRASGNGSSTTSHSRRGGRSGGVMSNGEWERAYRWAQRQVSCFTDEDGRTTWVDRDEHRRVVRVRRFAAGIFACSQPGDPAEEMPTTSDVRYAYGLERTVAPGLPPVKLDIPTSVTKASLLSGGGHTVQTYDFGTAWAPGDPSGYECVPGGVTLPVGAAPCRVLEAGFTRTLAGVTVPETRATFYSYDQHARVTKVIGPLSLSRPYADDVAPLEARTYYPTDDVQVARRGRLKSVERSPSGTTGDTNASIATYDYVQTGVASVTVRRWQQSASSHAEDTLVLVNDERGRPASTVGPAGVTSVEYFDGRRPSLVVTPGGGAYRLLYWPFGRVKEIQALASDPRPSGANPATLWREVRTYDASGNPTLVERFDANGALRFSQARAFDADHRLLTADHPSDPTRKATWAYTPAGRLDFWVDEGGTRTELSPDATGRPRGVARVIRDANQAVLDQLQLATYVWETPEDLVKSVTDGAGNTTTTVHDDFGRVVSVDAPGAVGATPARLEWDVRSNLKRRTLGSATVTYAYDGLDRVKTVSATTTAGAEPVYQAFTYDFDGGAGSMVGRLRTAASGTSAATLKRTTTYSWDAAGRLERESLAVSGVTATLETVHAYDANGVETTVTYPSGFSAVLHPDEAGQVTGVDARSSTGATRPLATLVRHEPLGPVRSMTFGNNLSMSRVSNLRYEPDLLASGPLAFDYGVGWSGNVETVATNGTGTTTFGYDLADRLTSLTPGLGASVPSVAYAYTDPSLKQAVTQAKVMTGAALVPAQAFGYDQQRNLSAVGKYDAAGVTIPTTVCLVHDALGRLTAVGPALARLAGPGALACQQEVDLAAVTTRFEYDAFGRRAARQDGSSWVEYVHEPGGRLLAEAVRPVTAGGAWATRREYVWLDGQPLAQLEYPGPAGRTDGWTYYVHLDHLGTPRALTSEAGATVWSAAPVRPYGDIVETTATDPANGRTVLTNLRLPGQYDERLLASVGLQGPYQNWHRWYLPSMGRYMELDPIAMSGGFNGPWGPDWYGYALQAPLTNIDPDGRYWAQPPILPPVAGPVAAGWAGWAFGSWLDQFVSDAIQVAADFYFGPADGRFWPRAGPRNPGFGPPGVRPAPPMPVPSEAECDEEWANARRQCDELFKSQRCLPPQLRGGRKATYEQCLKGFVSEVCGGNPKDWGPVGPHGR